MAQLLSPDHYTFNPYAVPLVVTALAALALGLSVLVRQGPVSVSRALIRLVLVAAAFMVALAARYCAADDATALAWARIVYVPIAFLAPAIYAFVTRLLGRHKTRRPIVYAAWALGFLFAVAALSTDALVVGVRHYPWGPYDRLGSGVVPFLVFFIGLLLGAFVELRQAYRNQVADETQRRRLRSFGVLFLVASLALVDYLPSFGIAVYPVGYLAVLVFLFGAAFVVDRYDLLELTPALAAEEILATVPDLLMVCDADGRIRVANAVVARTLGYKNRELLERPLTSLAQGKTDRARIAELLDSRTEGSREVSLRSRSGARVDVSVDSSTLRDGNGRAVGFVVLARDVGPRRRMEAALRASERHFRSLIENGSDLITVLTPDLLIRYQSPSVERILGHTPDSRVGRPFLETVHEDDRDRLAALLQRARAEPGTTLTVEYRTTRHGDGEQVLEGHVRNLLEEPAVAGIVVNSRDVTRQRRMEARLRQRQRLESVGHLAGGVAHDFNNLLTTIQGHLCLLDEDETLTDEARSDLAEIREATARAAELTRQLMAFSRQQVHRPELVELDGMLAEVQPLLQRLVGAGVQLDTCPGSGPMTVRADPDQLRQVLVDLAINARDAMPDGGRLTLAVHAEHLSRSLTEDDADAPTSGDYAVLRVSDTGTGMDMETRRRIFEPFFTTKGKGKGTGLGLSTAYGIIRQNRGTIEVESAPGRGTTFRILLPRAEDAITRTDDDVSPA